MADYQASSQGGFSHSSLQSTFTSSQHLLYPELASLALSTPLLDTVSSLLGPNLVPSRVSSIQI